MKKIIVLIILIVIIIWGGFLIYQKTSAPVVENNPNIYKNTEFGFQITLPDSWKGYTVEKQTWQGNDINGTGKYSGLLVIIKNPKTTAQAKYQDIPIMVITPEVWQGIVQEKIAVSAAPIPPAEIGQNVKYVFATPPRWYGFTDDQGFQEAVDAVKTFKSF